jgi:hypothetical protein
VRFLSILGVALLLGGASQVAWSLTVESRLSPQGLAANRRTFTVTTKPAGDFTEFDVTVTPDPRAPVLSPFVRGDLTLSTADEKMAFVRLEPKREHGKLSFWFRVSPKMIAGSRFEIGEQAYGVYTGADGNPQRDENGQPKVEPFIGGSIYWFPLRDFVVPVSDK